MSSDPDVQRLVMLVMKEWTLKDYEVEAMILTNSHSFETAISLCSNKQLRELSSSLIKIIKSLRGVIINIVGKEDEQQKKLVLELLKLEKELQ